MRLTPQPHTHGRRGNVHACHGQSLSRRLLRLDRGSSCPVAARAVAGHRCRSACRGAGCHGTQGTQRARQPADRPRRPPAEVAISSHEALVKLARIDRRAAGPDRSRDTAEPQPQAIPSCPKRSRRPTRMHSASRPAKRASMPACFQRSVLSARRICWMKTIGRNSDKPTGFDKTTRRPAPSVRD